MDIYLAASRFGKYPPLATSTSVNSCYLFFSVPRETGGGGGGEKGGNEEDTTSASTNLINHVLT